MTTYDYDREFRLKILALCLDETWLARYGNAIIKPEYFERDDEEAFANAVLTYWKKYGKPPRDPYDVIALCNGKYSIFVLDMYEYQEESDLSLAAETAIQFAREQAAKLAILDSVDDVKSGNINRAITRMKDALKVGEEILSRGLDPIRDVDDWLYNYWEDKVRTGLVHVDQVLGGGQSAGELGIVLGPTNMGKSMALVNIGYGAATIGSSKFVLHFSHEMRSAQVAKRYAARMIFRFPNQSDNLDDYAEEVILAARKLITGRIRVFDGKKTTDQVESIVEQVKAEGFEIGLIIDDYLDLMYPPQKYGDRRFELSATYDWFREFCFQQGVPGWSASQSIRGSYTKEIITTQDIAEDIGKANISDNMMALCQTYDEEKMQQCRLFMAKVRDSKRHQLISAKYYGAQQAIITTGFVDMRKEKDV